MKPLYISPSISLELLFTFVLLIAMAFPSVSNLFLFVAIILCICFITAYQCLLQGARDENFMDGIFTEIKQHFSVQLKTRTKFSFIEVFNILLFLFMTWKVASTVVHTTYMMFGFSIPVTSLLLTLYTLGRIGIMISVRKTYVLLTEQDGK